VLLRVSVLVSRTASLAVLPTLAKLNPQPAAFAGGCRFHRRGYLLA
jgi:hypothetical protein